MDLIGLSRTPSRRALLKLGAAIGAGAVLRGLTPDVALAQLNAGKDARLLVRSSRPTDLETPVALLDEFITPVEAFFVRSHMLAPQVDASTWRLAIDGDVATGLALSLDELRAMPQASVTATLECAGNGRAFFEPPVAGIQWGRGAVGTARWGGVPLSALLGAPAWRRVRYSCAWWAATGRWGHSRRSCARCRWPRRCTRTRSSP